MPDILIRGMEMPKSCAKCDLFGEYGCPFIGAVGYALTQGRRNEDCPLIELPPHGDLIDRSELLENSKVNGMYPHWIDTMDIKRMPVIVPAERSGADA